MIAWQQATPQAVAMAAERLAAGGLVAFPTETVYGLGAHASDDGAVAQVFAAKGRPADHPLIVHVADASAVGRFAESASPAAQRLMAAFWPGPLTLILQRLRSVAAASAGGQDSIGLRCPKHPVAQSLLAACAALGVHGISAPSANPFGRLSPTTAQHVAQGFADSTADILVLDGGACDVGIESAIVDCRGERLTLLRPGSLGLAALSAAAGQHIEVVGLDDPDAPRASGRLAQHYAPQAKLRLMDAKSLQAAIDVLAADAKHIAVYSRAALKLRSEHMLAKRMPDDAAACAQQLFGALHQFDAWGARLIWVEQPPDAPEWDGVRDRLLRASA